MNGTLTLGGHTIGILTDVTIPTFEIPTGLGIRLGDMVVVGDFRKPWPRGVTMSFRDVQAKRPSRGFARHIRRRKAEPS